MRDYAVANALCLLSLVLAAGGAWFYLRHAVARGGVRRAMTRGDGSRAGRTQRRMRVAAARWRAVGLVLGLLAFAIFGPLANLVLWAFAEHWYFPNKMPQEFGFTFWGRVFSAARRRGGVARHQRLDRDPHRDREPRGRDSRGLRAGAPEAALARR